MVVGGKGGGGGGLGLVGWGVEVVSESTKFCTFGCSLKAAVPCSNWIS